MSPKNFFIHDKCWSPKNIFIKSNLSNILEEGGIDKKEFLENIDKIKIKDELKKLTKLAFDQNIFGAPTFVVNNKIFWGQDRLDYALDEFNS